MKKIFSFIIVLLLFGTISVSAMTQVEIDQKLNEKIRSAEDYKDLITGNKLQNAFNILGIEYSSSMAGKVFRGIYHTEGWKEFSRSRSGLRCRTSDGLSCRTTSPSRISSYAYDYFGNKIE